MSSGGQTCNWITCSPDWLSQLMLCWFEYGSADRKKNDLASGKKQEKINVILQHILYLIIKNFLLVCTAYCLNQGNLFEPNILFRCNRQFKRKRKITYIFLYWSICAVIYKHRCSQFHKFKIRDSEYIFTVLLITN